MRLPADAVGPATTRVLLALVADEAATGRPTIRGVAARAGITLEPAHGHLKVLRELGLATWVDRQGGTLRPKVRTATFGGHAPTVGVRPARQSRTG